MRREEPASQPEPARHLAEFANPCRTMGPLRQAHSVGHRCHVEHHNRKCGFRCRGVDTSARARPASTGMRVIRQHVSKGDARPSPS